MNIFNSVIIHHSASPRSTTAAEIRSLHIGRGWHDIGYHWVIQEGGNVYVGRQLPRTGAHAPPNEGRIGICVTGDNTKAEHAWSMYQQVALLDLCRHLLGAMPWLRIERHCDVMIEGHTVCPAVEIDWLVDAAI